MQPLAAPPTIRQLSNSPLAPSKPLPSLLSLTLFAHRFSHLIPHVHVRKVLTSSLPSSPLEITAEKKMHIGMTLRTYSFKYSLHYLQIVIFLLLPVSMAVVVPSSNCYVLDNSSHLVDFTDWIGHPFEYDGKDADLVVRFCKDVETRSQTGYVDFGHYSPFNYFIAGSGPVNFVQEFYNGDLAKCENSFDKMGRTAQVNIICGECLHGVCKGDLGCICNVTYDSTMCRVLVELAIPCARQGPQVFPGFTVGFHPRSWEVVYNGMTQLGFEQVHREFSFGTEQTHVSLYLTAISSLSKLVGKPTFKVYPEKGLEVKLSGSGADGRPPTTLSPTVLTVNWRCEDTQDKLYEVFISIPVEGHDHVEFTLTKLCEYRQTREGEAMRGWATLGVISCVFIVLLTVFCCGGFIYRTRIEHQHGLDALPGMTILSACLEAVTGPRGYAQAGDVNGAFINQPPCENASTSQEAQRPNERKYGSM